MTDSIEKGITRTEEYVLKELSITSYTGTFTRIKEIFTEVNLFEDIYSNILTGSVTIIDGNNLQKNLPIIGEETLRLAFYTAGKSRRDSIDLEFDVYKVSPKVKINDRSYSYTLYFASKEFLQSRKEKISQAYNDTPENIIQDILTNKLDSNKQLITDPTKYNQQCVIPNWNPLYTANWIARRALPEGFSASSYFLYETTRGFNFRCLESLQNTSVPHKQEYIYQPANLFVDGRRDIDRDFRNVSEFEINESFNTLENLESGMYGNKLYTFDPTTKKYEIFDYDYRQDFENIQHVEPSRQNLGQGLSALVSNNKDSKNKLLTDYPEAHSRFYTKNSFLFDDNQTNRVDEWFQSRISLLQQFENIKINILVSGDSSRNVGDVVQFTIPSYESQDKTTLDFYYSGRFLITGIRHIINKDAYNMKIELTKDSLSRPLPNSTGGIVTT